MKLSKLTEQKHITTYWKVVKDPNTNFIPGYATTSRKIIASYLWAFMSGSNNPDFIAYVMEFEIDTSKLIKIDKPVGGYKYDVKTTPGYFGPSNKEPADGSGGMCFYATYPLEVIVYNKPVSATIVGAYKTGLSIDPTKSYASGYYRKDSNLFKDSTAKNWTTNDLQI